MIFARVNDHLRHCSIYSLSVLLSVLLQRAILPSHKRRSSPLHTARIPMAYPHPSAPTPHLNAPTHHNASPHHNAPPHRTPTSQHTAHSHPKTSPHAHVPAHYHSIPTQHTAPQHTKTQHTAETHPSQHTAKSSLHTQHTAQHSLSPRHTASPPSRPNTCLPFTAFTPCPTHLKPKSTLRPDNWAHLLKDYPDKAFVDTITGIATYGARLGYLGPLQSVCSPNHSSALRIPADIHENLTQDLLAGRVKRLKDLPSHYISSPIGAVHKKSNGEFTGWRRIHDLSFPPGRSVNNGISKHFRKLKYQTLDDAVDLLLRLGPGTIMHKRDLKDAFRKIPVSPYDYWLLIFEWQGKHYVDIFLPFGLATAPCLFNLFAEGLHWILEHVFSQSLVHYLDDFLLFGDDDEALFGRVCECLGFTEKTSKSLNGTVVDFTGIEIDSDRMEIRLPKDKHTRALMAVKDTLAKGSTNFLALRSLLGFLSFCARVIPLGRPFLRNLFNFLYILRAKPGSNRRLLPDAARDLRWWATLLKHWNGKRVIRPRNTSYFGYTDASGTKGIGGWWGPNAFATRIPRRHRAKHINWKEAFAILVALAKWAPCLAGSRLILMCDNQAIVQAINKRSIRGEAINPLQLILLAAAVHDVEIEARWLSSEENWIADSLSRFDLKKLANCKLDVLFNMPYHGPNPKSHSSPPSTPHFSPMPTSHPNSSLSRSTGPHLAALRRRLQDFYNTELPMPQEIPIRQPGTATNASPTSATYRSSQSRMEPYRNGWQTPSIRERQSRKRSTDTSSASRTATLKKDSQRMFLTTPASNEFDGAQFVYSAQPQLENEGKSNAPSCSKCWAPSEQTPLTKSTFAPRSRSHSQPSSELESSHGTNGPPKATPPTSPADPSLFSITTLASSSTCLAPKPTRSAKEQPFHSPQQMTSPVLSQPSTNSFSATPAQPPTHYSPALSAHSTSTGSKARLSKQYSTPAEILPQFQATRSAVELQTRQSQQGSPKTKSRNSADGNPQQSTDTSHRNHLWTSASP